MELENYLNLKNKIILVGGDHHAHHLVEKIYAYLQKQSVKVQLIRYDAQCEDYISQTVMIASQVSKDPKKYAGIIGCKNGFGTTVLSNKFPHVFAARCDNPQQAIKARQVNYCNVLTFGSDFVNEEVLNEITEDWLNTNFEINEKNRGRLVRLFQLEQELKNCSPKK